MGAACQRKEPIDEAKAAGRTTADFPTHAADIFQEMDGGVELTDDAVKGRNTWMIWTGGNEAFWDYLARHGYGLVDLLKLLDSRHVKRSDRLRNLGLINEPGFTETSKPDQYGLWLDQRAGEEYESAPDPKIYGYSSGVIGMRLFPNPAFDEEARGKWDPERFMTDPVYYKSPELVRPYRVGMSCAFCHVAFHPLFPPENPTEPEWRNLSSLIGNQYFKVDEIFGYDLEPDDLILQLLRSSRPGTIDTSLVASDGINNPNANNPVFEVEARLAIARKVKPERLDANSLAVPELPGQPDDDQRFVPHILMGGEDSIGTIGALARVWLNIGTFYEEWIRNHNVIVGITEQQPFEIAKANENSVYWQVTVQRCFNLGKFLLAASRPMRLEDARWRDSEGNERRGSEFINDALVDQGKRVFAKNCIFCHSSKQPSEFFDDPVNYEKWSQDETYLTWAQEAVQEDDFRDNNYFSTDQRYPITLIETNAARSLADNATEGRMWEEFSSRTYKDLPSVGSLTVRHPYEQRPYSVELPAGGPGRYRPPTLLGIWATAPFLHNNTVGDYPDGHDPRKGQTPDVSVEGRLQVFNNSVEKLLWPEQRDAEESIVRTTTETYLEVPYIVLPGIVRVSVWLLVLAIILIAAGLFVWGSRKRKLILRVVGVSVLVAFVGLTLLGRYFLSRHGVEFTDQALRIGPIPQGTPINLVLNLNDPGSFSFERLGTLLAIAADLGDVMGRKLPSLNHEDVPELVPNLLKLNKCPDFEINRGHLFASGLTDAEKQALIEFLKTL